MSAVFETLNAINVGDKIEKKGRFSYLSWAWAWAEVKKRFPDVNYTVYKNDNGWNYHTDGKTAWVEVGVTIDGIEYIEMLPIMNNNNASLPLESINSFVVNKSIKRCLTKALAFHGLGLYIYAGEDLPEDENEKKTESKSAIKNEELASDELVLEFSKVLSNEQKKAVFEKYKIEKVQDLPAKTVRQLIERAKETNG